MHKSLRGIVSWVDTPDHDNRWEYDGKQARRGTYSYSEELLVKVCHGEAHSIDLEESVEREKEREQERDQK